MIPGHRAIDLDVLIVAWLFLDMIWQLLSGVAKPRHKYIGQMRQACLLQYLQS